jgi:hypothetical protein
MFKFRIRPRSPVSSDAQPGGSAGTNILDAYSSERPGPQQTLDIFRGEWSSAMPAGSGLQTSPGAAALFEDTRVTWAVAQAGGIAGRRILEIGPLEGGHSYMLEQAGAAEVVAVEANSRSFLKCLCTKEVLGMRAVRFLFGDGMAFMEHDAGGFDMVFASGVLYHLRDPLAFLRLLPRMAPRLFLWSHYFDEAIIRNASSIAHKFGAVERSTIDGFDYEYVEQSYKEALQWSGFCGGSAPTSRWLNRRSIVGFLHHIGYRRIEMAFEAPDHPNGPAFALYAELSGYA